MDPALAKNPLQLKCDGDLAEASAHRTERLGHPHHLDGHHLLIRAQRPDVSTDPVMNFQCHEDSADDS